LNLFADQASIVKVGMPVTLIPETAPDKEFQSKVSFIEPFYRSEAKTVAVRIFFNNKEMQIPIGSQVKAKIEAMTSETDWLPRDAVLSLGLNSVVLLKQDNGFKVHPVKTGITTATEIQIFNGINTADSVASNAQFL